jgi:Flp pilus assembly protein TadG
MNVLGYLQRVLSPGQHSEDGSALIEFALTLPTLCGLLFCFLELCLLFYSYDMISESAREGTRYAIVRGASCQTSAGVSCETTAAKVNTYVSNLGWPNLAGGTMVVDTTYPNGTDAVGNPVQTKVTYTFRITMHFVPTNNISLSSTSVMYILQ